MKLTNIIFCDDVRQEIHNKLSLIGVYNNKIVLNVSEPAKVTWPQPITLSALLRFSVDNNESLHLPDAFEFTYLLNEKSVFNLTGELKVNPDDLSQLQIVIKASVPIEPGYLGFTIKLYSAEQEIFAETHDNALRIIMFK